MASIVFKELRIPLSSVEEGVSTFHFRTVPPDLCAGGRVRFPQEIGVEVQVTTVGEDYLIDIKVEGEGECVCDRCSESFLSPIGGKVQTLFTFDIEKAGNEGSIDVKLLPLHEQMLDISQDVLDALVLAIPSKCLCREECKGLCCRCGANLNEGECSCPKDEVDPRWQALKGLTWNP